MTDATYIEAWLYRELKHIAGLTPENAKRRLVLLLLQTKPRAQRTPQQNKAMHKNFDLIAKKLNAAGYDMRKLLKIIEIPWTTESVKQFIWKPVQKSMTGKEHTADLEKHLEIDHIHEVVMRELGRACGIEWHDFPHDPEKEKQYSSTLSPLTPVRREKASV